MLTQNEPRLADVNGGRLCVRDSLYAFGTAFFTGQTKRRMIDAKKRLALHGHAERHWTSQIIGAPGREKLVDATIREYEAELKERPGKEPREWIIKNRVKADPEVRKFIPLPIIIAIVGWIVTWIITWLKKDAAFSRPHDYLGAD